MAFHIEVIKTSENDYFAYYNYQYSFCAEYFTNKAGKKRCKLRKIAIGKLKIDKKNGDVHTLELAENDNNMHAKRAAFALQRDWKKGEFLEKTYWES